LDSNQLNGEVPSLGELNRLQSLQLQNNQLQYISPSMKQPPMISECDLSHNPFSCPLPNWVLVKCAGSCN